MKGKEKISTGKQQKHGGEAFNVQLGGETDLLSGSAFYVGGAMFQWGRYWGGVIGDEPKTTPCTSYSLFDLQRVIALKVEASSARAAFDFCSFTKNV